MGGSKNISEKYKWINEEYWDIFVAEQFNTTPWDVRDNISLLDLERIKYYNEAMNKARRTKDVEEQQKSKIHKN
ncbi:MAG: hypothetical protein AABY07_02770 [Nanoarchaeota archaeon]